VHFLFISFIQIFWKYIGGSKFSRTWVFKSTFSDFPEGSLGMAFQYEWHGSGYAHPHTKIESLQAIHWARLAIQNDVNTTTILNLPNTKWYNNNAPMMDSLLRHPSHSPFSTWHNHLWKTNNPPIPNNCTQDRTPHFVRLLYISQKYNNWHLETTTTISNHLTRSQHPTSTYIPPFHPVPIWSTPPLSDY
jgi:hypothetical protein